MSEIKGAPCARRAHSHGRVSRFSEVCTQCVHVFLSQLLWLHIKRVHGEIPGRTVSGDVRPVGTLNKTFRTLDTKSKTRGGGGEVVQCIAYGTKLSFIFARHLAAFILNLDDKTLKRCARIGHTLLKNVLPA